MSLKGSIPLKIGYLDNEVVNIHPEYDVAKDVATAYSVALTDVMQVTTELAKRQLQIRQN